MVKINDVDIRFKYILENKEFFNEGIFLNEYDINGTSRVDFALFREGIFHGYEIKGSQDTTGRLISQLKSYLKFFDYVHLIIHRKHEKETWEILNKYKLTRVGVIIVDDLVNFRVVREASGLDKKMRLNSLMRNLKKEDFQELLSSKKLSCKFNSKDALMSYIIGKVTLDEVVSKLERRLKISYAKRCPSCKSNLVYKTRLLEKRVQEFKEVSENRKRYTQTVYDLVEDSIVNKCIECSSYHNKKFDKIVSKTIRYKKEFDI